MKDRTTYKALMKKINNGYVEVDAWEDTITNNECHAIVRLYKSNGTSRRIRILVIKLPADFAN
ncbi:MAG: hypothetical protein DDT21_01877 [Syntrophomonadaceae bacterium]|nr:hypothetical protein [Bacillota bacterium]